MERLDLEDEAHLRTLTTPHQWKTGTNWDLMFGQKLTECLPLDNGRHLKNPSAILGDLERLPAELLLPILTQQIDLQSLTDLRRVSQRAMDIVDSIPEYHVIVKHAPDALRAVLIAKKDNQVTCQRMFNKLISFECERCGEFGGLLYLITFKRLCWGCFMTNLEFIPILESEVGTSFLLTKEELQAVDHIVHPPSRNMEDRDVTDGKKRYDLMVLLSVASENREKNNRTGNIFPFTAQEIKEMTGWRLKKNPRSPLARNALLDYPGFSLMIDQRTTFGTSTRLKRLDELIKASILFPYFDKSTKMAEFGFLCEECVRVSKNPWVWYNMATFKKHLADSECGKIFESKM